MGRVKEQIGKAFGNLNWFLPTLSEEFLKEEFWGNVIWPGRFTRKAVSFKHPSILQYSFINLFNIYSSVAGMRNTANRHYSCFHGAYCPVEQT